MSGGVKVLFFGIVDAVIRILVLVVFIVITKMPVVRISVSVDIIIVMAAQRI